MCDEDYALGEQLPRGRRTLRREGDELSVQSDSCWHQWALDELSQMQFFSEGWDGDQAPRPDRLMLASASGFVQFLAEEFSHLSAPYISLSPNSTLILSWSTKDKTLDAEFVSSDKVRYFFKARKTNERKSGTLRHNRCDSFFLTQLREFSNVEYHTLTAV